MFYHIIKHKMSKIKKMRKKDFMQKLEDLKKKTISVDIQINVSIIVISAFYLYLLIFEIYKWEKDLIK